MTDGAGASSQICRVCGRVYPLDSPFCNACGARSPADPVLDASPPGRPASVPVSREEADAALEEFRRSTGSRDILTGRSGGDVLSLDDGDLLSGGRSSRDDAEEGRE